MHTFTDSDLPTSPLSLFLSGLPAIPLGLLRDVFMSCRARGAQNVARHNTELSGGRKELDWRPCEPSKVCSLNEHSISFIATSLPLFFSHSSVLEKIFPDLRESHS